MSPDIKHFDNCLKCAVNSNLPSVKVLGDKYGNAVSLKLIYLSLKLMSSQFLGFKRHSGVIFLCSHLTGTEWKDTFRHH